MKSTSIVAALLAVALVGGVAGCTKRDEPIGPAQKAGQAIDNAGDKFAREVHDKLDRANEAARQVADSAEQTKGKIAEATADAGKGLEKATEEVGKKVERAGEKIQEAAKK
jgi:F0F1-type ATP synthase membrane subunit b/b'